METLLVIVIVSVVVLWACWSSYRMFTGKNGGCNCAGSCRKDDCSELSHNNDKKKNLKN